MSPGRSDPALWRTAPIAVRVHVFVRRHGRADRADGVQRADERRSEGECGSGRKQRAGDHTGHRGEPRAPRRGECPTSDLSGAPPASIALHSKLLVTAASLALTIDLTLRTPAAPRTSRCAAADWRPRAGSRRGDGRLSPSGAHGRVRSTAREGEDHGSRAHRGASSDSAASGELAASVMRRNSSAFLPDTAPTAVPRRAARRGRGSRRYRNTS